MNSLRNLMRRLRAAFNGQPCPHWADYLHDTAERR